jgi:uncharacterized SAM-binding protein YcdF (DUF218 family)
MSLTRRSQPKQKTLSTHKPRRRLLGLVSLVVVVGAIAHRHVQIAMANPQAALVLGGLESREAYAAQLAQAEPDLEIWISSGSPEGYVRHIFQQAGIDRDRLHLDYEAQDTLTNFTTLVDDLEERGIKSVYLITSDNHMRRARVVGEIVFGSRGILIKPQPVATPGENEALAKCALDGLRALLWLATGHTGAELKTELARVLRLDS